MSRRAKQWVALTWAALVALGGGATLVIENAGPPEDLVGVYEPGRAPGRSPAGGDDCSPPPGIAADDSDGVFDWACLEVVGPSPSVEGPAVGDDSAPDPFPGVPRSGEDEPCSGEEHADHTIVFCVYAEASSGP